MFLKFSMFASRFSQQFPLNLGGLSPFVARDLQKGAAPHPLASQLWL
jgi:hypothetical protein